MRNGAEKQEYTNSVSQGTWARLIVKVAHIIQLINVGGLIVKSSLHKSFEIGSVILQNTLLT